MTRQTPPTLFASVWLALFLSCHAGSIHDAIAKRDLVGLERALKNEPKEINGRCHPDFETPLVMAVVAGDPTMVKLLLNAGADLTLPSPALLRFTALQETACGARSYSAMLESGLESLLSGDPRVWLRCYSQIKKAAPVETALEQAARLDVMAHLLAKRPELNKGFETFPPLHLAALRGDVGMAKLLLNSGAEVDCRATKRMTPLHGAAAMGKGRTMIDLLVTAGADVDANDNYGRTPLMYAAYRGDPGTVTALFAHGACLDAEDLTRKSVICYAAEAGHEEIVRQLYRKGGSELIRNGKKHLLFRYAAAGGSKALAEILLTEGLDVNLADAEGFTPLLTAVEFDQRELARFLIEKGADKSAKNQKGHGLLAMAAASGNIELAKELLDDAGAPKPETGKLDEALFEAAVRGRVMMVEFLLERSADVNGVNHDGATTLWCACAGDAAGLFAPFGKQVTEEDYAQIVESLLDHGAKVEERGPNGMTPVHMAAMMKRGPRVMKALLKAGANPSPPSATGKTTVAPLLIAAAMGTAESFQVLLDAGADLKVEDFDGNTALHLAARHGNVEVVKLLLAQHLSPNRQNKRHGPTPLHLASKVNSLECVKVLLENGADPNLRDKGLGTPLTIAVMPTEMDVDFSQWELREQEKQKAMLRAANLQDRLRIIHLLLASGAEAGGGYILKADQPPVTLVQLAAQNRRPEIAELLRNPPPVARKTHKP